MNEFIDAENGENAVIQAEHNEFEAYFQNMKVNNQSSKSFNMPESKIQQEIKQGKEKVDLSNKQKKNSFSTLIRNQNKSEEEIAAQLRRKQIRINLNYLTGQYRGGKHSKSKESLISKQYSKMVFTKQQHRQFMNKIKKRKQSFIQFKEKKDELKKRHLQEEKQRIRKQKEEQKAKSLQKKKEIQERLEENKIKLEEKIKWDEITNKKIDQLKNKKYLHSKMEQKYENQIILPHLQEKKKKLQHLREFNKPLDFQDIKSHENEYIKQKEKNLETSQLKLKEQKFDYKKPTKSEHLIKILEEENTKLKIDKEEKKRKIDEKQKRTQQFLFQLKQKHPLKISQEKREEIEKRLRIQERTIKDSKQIGLGYLKVAKRKRKSMNNQEYSFTKQKQRDQQNVNKTHNYLKHNNSQDYYGNLRRKKIEQILRSDEYESAEKRRILQFEAQRLEEQSKRKEQLLNIKNQDKSQSLKLLVSSIQTKMDLMSLLYKE